ncbi:MAG: tetratricopeptide repeat protein [Acidobacteria bacterium]|jgi:Flp pilus assembly protein TadD|nr:tetratricopeptide repeat protein [Acidobacteriota bacterium]
MNRPKPKTSQPAAKSRGRLRQVLILLAIALAVRVLYLYQIAPNPYFHNPIIDAQTYDEMAVAIAAGQEPIPAPFFQPPLYPYFLGLLYALFGRDLLLVRLVQMALGTANVWLLYLLGGRLFDRRVGFAAALAFAMYGTMLFYEGELLAPVLIVFLNLLLALAAIATVDSPSLPRALLAGVLLGLSSLAMSVILPMALVIPAYAGWRWRRAPARPKAGRALALLAAFAAGMLLVIAPVTWRNWRISHEFVPISTNGGINFYLSTGRDFERKTAIRPGYEWEELLTEPIRLGIHTASGHSAYFMNKALGLIAADPAGYAGLLLKKLSLFANGNEIMRDQDIYPFRQYSPLLSLLVWKKWLAFPYGLLLPLALLGMMLALRCRAPGAALPLAFILSHVVVLLAFFITARYRLNILPFLVLFAAYGALRMWDLLRQRRWTQSLPLLAVLAALLLFCNWRSGPMSRDFSVDSYYNLATKLLKAGETAQAKNWLLKAIELDPLNPEVNGNLGMIYEQERQPHEAKKCYLRILESHPHDVQAHLHLADLCLRLGEFEKAGQHYEQVLQVEPENESALHGTQFARGLARQRDAAARFPMVRSILEQLGAKPDDPGLLNDLGAAYVSCGYPDMAIEPLRLVIAAGQHLSSAHNNLGIARMQLGDRDGAKREFLAALASDAGNVNAKRNLAILLQSGEEKRAPRP